MRQPIRPALKRTLARFLALLLPPTGKRRRAPVAHRPMPMAPTRTVTGLALLLRPFDPPGAIGARWAEPRRLEPRPAPPGPAPYVRPYLIAYEERQLRTHGNRAGGQIHGAVAV